MTLVILPLGRFWLNLALGEGSRTVRALPPKSVMSSLNKSTGKDWTHLLTDPELVGHIGKLLQAYREAAPDKREEALLAAMRKIRKESAGVAAKSGASAAEAAARAAETSTTTSATTSTSVRSHPVGTAAATAAAMESAPERAGISSKPSTPEVTVPVDKPSAIRPPFVPDLFTPSFGQDRRTYPRIRCFIAVELRCEGWETPVWGNLANVSAGGCLIETVEPVRKSTKLEVGLWANNGKVWVKGIVINGIVTENNPTFGVRLKYTDMDASDRDTLRFFLKFVEDTTKNYEKQNGYLAQLKR